MDFWSVWLYRGCQGWHNSLVLDHERILKDGSLNWEEEWEWGLFWPTWKARWESVRLTFDWKRKDDAVVVVPGKAVPIVPFVMWDEPSHDGRLTALPQPPDVVGLQCVYSQQIKEEQKEKIKHKKQQWCMDWKAQTPQWFVSCQSAPSYTSELTNPKSELLMASFISSTLRPKDLL